MAAMIYLDTHVVVWLYAGMNKIGQTSITYKAVL